MPSGKISQKNFYLLIENSHLLITIDRSIVSLKLLEMSQLFEVCRSGFPSIICSGIYLKAYQDLNLKIFLLYIILLLECLKIYVLHYVKFSSRFFCNVFS